MGRKKGKAVVLSSDSSGPPMDLRKRKAVIQSDSSSDEPTPTKDEYVTRPQPNVRLYQVPIAPAFQADVPVVTEVLDLQSYRNVTEDSKWLGTLVWSGEDDADNSDIGRGRPTANCSCGAPGSEQCVRLLVTEKREQLRHQLGPAFEAWGFDGMGEDVAKSWDVNTETIFKNLVSREEEILQPELPDKLGKTYKEMISYYFNVLVLRRVNAQARHGDHVDSDDDTYVDKRRKSRVSQAASASSKFLKPLR